MSTTLPILRRSAIQTAQSCLFRFKKVWLEGVPDQSDPALRGIAFHSCAHQYITRLVEKQIPADYEEAKDAFVDGIAFVLTPAHLVPEVRTIFMGWAERFVLELGAFVTAEEHQVGKDDRSFTPDLVYGRPEGLEIVDWKTYWKPMTEHQVRADFQARFYTYVGMKVWPNFPRYLFTHEYVRFGTRTSVEFDPQTDFAALDQEIEATARAIAHAHETDDWPATAGPECGYCELACPLVDHPALVPARVSLPDQAVKVGALILAGEQHLTLAKKALKSYCQANGPVSVQGVVFDHRPTVQRSYPVETVMDALKSCGVLNEQIATASGLTISHSALSGVLKAFPQVADEIRPYVSEKTAYRFGAAKPGGDEEDSDG